MADNRDQIEREIRDLASIAEVAFRNISNNIQEVFEDVLSSGENVISSLTKDMITNINSLAKSSNNLIINQSRINKGLYTYKDLSKQILANEDKLYKLEQQKLSTIQAINDDVTLTDNERQQLIESINTEYFQAILYNKDLAKTLEEQAKQLKLIEKRTGVTAKILTGLKKIPILGDLLNIDNALENMRSKANDTNSTFKILGAGIKGAFEGIEKASVILGLVAAAKKIFDFFVDAMFAADKRVTDIAKNISISKDSAQALYESFQESKGILDSQLATTKNITEAFNELANISDFINVSTTKQLDTQIQLTKEIGIQVEEALQLQQLFAVNNNEADKGLDIVYDQIAAFANQNKIVADGRKIIADVSKLSGLIKLNFRGNTGEIVKTVLEAKKLGLTLDQITKTQSSLLDFESSISSQIEAELLTGRQINLERARLFALNNDIAGLTEEIAKQNITAASFSKMNALQQESIAKTLGMSASELGDSLFKQELINKTSGDYTKNLRENAKILRDQGKLEKANRLERQAEAVEQGIIEGKSLEQAQKSLDAQTKFNTALEHVQEIFTDLVDGEYLDVLADNLVGIAKALSSGKSILGALFSSEDYAEQAKNERIIREAEREKNLKNQTNSVLPVNDFIIKTHPKDTLVMAGGTKLGNNDETLKAQQETNMLLKQLLNKSTDITLNGERLTSGLAKQTYALGS
jgi:hypothetical protein